jgi:acetyl-CoA acyltransferase
VRDAVVVDAVRTPVGKGKPGGALAAWHPADLLAETLAELVRRNDLTTSGIDDVIVGCGSQAGEQAQNIGRTGALAAGFDERVPATTIDRQCGSSQQAIHFAAQAIQSGSADVVIAAGVESMSRVPMFSNLQGKLPFGTRFLDRYPGGMVHQGISAELINAKWGLSRAELDDYAVESHRRADLASTEGRFDAELFAVDLDASSTDRVVTRDEGIRPQSNREALAELRPAFHSPERESEFPEIPWHVTAGNSSQISDGSAAVLIMAANTAAALGYRARARIHSMSVIGDDPVIMLTAIIPATRSALDRVGMSIADIDLFEVNEAFASPVLSWQREFGVPHDKLNVHGGAIALGHPIGASGARLATTLLNALEGHDATFGLQTMCEGGGMANATIIERL